MKREYDFSKAERGKFYRRGAKMILPIYLDATLQKQLEPLARNQGKGIGEVVNDILKNQVQLLTTLNPSKRPNKPMQPTRSAAKPRRVPSARKRRSPRRGLAAGRYPDRRCRWPAVPPLGVESRIEVRK